MREQETKPVQVPLPLPVDFGLECMECGAVVERTCDAVDGFFCSEKCSIANDEKRCDVCGHTSEPIVATDPFPCCQECEGTWQHEDALKEYYLGDS